MAISWLYQLQLYEAKNEDLMKKQMINLEKMCKDSINMCRRVFLVREEAWKFGSFGVLRRNLLAWKTWVGC